MSQTFRAAWLTDSLSGQPELETGPHRDLHRDIRVGLGNVLQAQLYLTCAVPSDG